jgi:ApaG protein
MLYQNRGEAIEIRVRPEFSLSRSSIEEGRYVFTYDVTIENHRPEPVRLLYRHWHIHESNGDDREVGGEGVVGTQPLILPGEAHDYRSYCVLGSPIGEMDGHYVFVSEDGESFRVGIPHFPLIGPIVPPGIATADAPDAGGEGGTGSDAEAGWN